MFYDKFGADYEAVPKLMWSYANMAKADLKDHEGVERVKDESNLWKNSKKCNDYWFDKNREQTTM